MELMDRTLLSNSQSDHWVAHLMPPNRKQVGTGGCMCAQSLQLCPTHCNPMDCSPPGSSVRGILQARIPEWVAMPFSRGSSWPRDWTVSLTSPALASGFFTTSDTWKVTMRELFREGEHILSACRRQWHPTPVLLPGKSHGRRSLVGCSPWGC